MTAAAQSLAVGFSSGGPGASVVVPLTFSGDGVAHLQVDVEFDDTVLSPVAVIPGVAFADHLLDWSVVAPGVLRVVAWSPSCAPGSTSADLRRESAAAELGGGVLVQVSWQIAAAAVPGTTPLDPVGAVLSTPDGTALTATLDSGGVEITLEQAVIEIPTLDEWGLFGLALLLLGAAVWVLRRGAAAGVVASLVFLLVTQPLLGQVPLRSSGSAGADRVAAGGTPSPRAPIRTAAALGDPGDADGDGSLTPADLAAVVDAILERGAAAGDPDCNEDGFVDVLDLACVVAAYCADGPPDNLPPSLAPIGAASLRVGEVLAFQASASDPDPGDELTFSLLSAPVGMVVDPGAGSVLWVPQEPQVGTVTPRLRVTDQGGLFAERDFVVSVRAFGAPPVLQPIADQATVEGSAIAVTAVATDPDLPADVLTFSLPLSPAGMTIGATSGQIAWTPGSSQVGVHDVTVQVEDQEGLIDFTHFVASVGAVNRPPVARDEVYEARLGVPLAVAAPGVLGNDEDPDGDPLTAALVDDAAQGVLSLAADGGLDYLLEPPDRTTPVELELLCDNTRRSSEGSPSAVDSRYQTNATPVVGDVDGDGDIEIVGAAVLSGATFLAELWIMNAADCSEQLETGATVEAAGGFSPNTQFGLHDIDGDGDLEIIGTRARFPFAEGGLPDDEHLIAIHHDGTLAWPGNGGSETSTILAANPNTFQYRHAGPTFADLDGDGTVEIVMPFSIGSGFNVFSGVVVYDATDGSIVWEFVSDFRQGGGNDQKVAYVVDLDLDGTMEVIIHNSVLDHLGQLEFELPSEPSAGTFTAGHLTLGIGNFDDDPFPELIGRDQRYLYLFEHDGTLTWKQEKRNNSEGQIAVADFDGDGEAEWAHVTCGTFGFVDCAPYFLAVYKADGSLLWSHESEPDFHLDRTWNRSVNPTAFDANRDGAFDLVFRNDTFGVETLFIFDGRDGSVLTSVPAGKYTGEQRFVVIADVDGDGHAELITSYTGGIAGQTEVWTGSAANPLPAAAGYRHQWIFHEAYVNDDLTIPQNPVPHWLQPGRNGYHMITQEPDPLIGTTDSFTYVANDGALDSNLATVTLDILPPGNPPRFLSEPDTLTTRGFQYLYRPWVVDPDLGDTVTFRLTAGPAGMTIDPATGEVRWQPDTLGVFDVAILALDTIGFATAQTYELTVGDPVVVPDVVGDPEAAAESALVAADLLVGRRTVANHPTIPLGSVAAQAPVGGSVAEFGGTVHLVLSLGPAPEDVDGDGDGFSPNQGDCDDGNASIHPGAADPLGDGIDQDCDGFDGSEPIAEIVIEPASLVLLEGERRQLTAYALFADGTSQIATGIVTWGSLPATTATVSATGLLTAVADTGPATITATRGVVVGTADVTVTDHDAADDDAPEVEITSPGDGDSDSVFAPVDVLGTAADPNLVRYELAISPAGEEAFTVIGGGTSSVVGGVLGQLDPTLMLNGLHTLRLTVLDAGGNETVDEVTVAIDGQRKVGLFTVTFTDLTLPLGGLPIVIERVYDSRDKRKGDFGVGWQLALRGVELSCSSVLGEDWFVAKSGISFSLLPTREHACAVSAPGGRLEMFDFETNVSVSPLVPFVSLVGSLVPRSGTLGVLEIVDNTNFLIADPQPGPIQLLDDQTLAVFNPQDFRYTAPDGTVFVFEDRQLMRVIDRNGNELVFSSTGIEHSSGVSVTFQRDAQDRIVGITDPLGNSQQYTYSASGDLIRHTDAGGNVSRYHYNSYHGLLRIEDPLGNPTIRNEYDTSGRMIATEDAAGNRTEFLYDDVARTLTTHFPDGSTRVVEYDEQGNATSLGTLVTIDGVPVFSQETYEYDALGNETVIVDADGLREERAYSGTDLTLRTIDPGGLNIVEEDVYDGGGEVVQSIDGAGSVRGYEYDARGNPVFSPGPGGVDIGFNYTAKGLPSAIDNGRGDRTQLTYSATGQVTVQEVRALAGSVLQRTEHAYDANGRLTSRTEVPLYGEGPPRTTTFVYDSVGQVVTVIDPAGGTTTFEYDGNGNRTAEVDPLGLRTETDYDARGLMVERRWPDGGVETFGYDHAGRQILFVDPDGVETETEYDELGRAVATRVEGNVTERRILTPAGRLAASIDGNGHRTDYEYDGAGRLVRTLLPEVLDAASGLMARPEFLQEYDAAGRRRAIVDALGQRTEFSYDVAGFPSLTTYPDGTAREQVFDIAGNLVEVIDEEGHSTLFEYDAARRLVRVLQPAPGAGEPRPETVYAYDSLGDLRTRTDALGRTTAFEYDAAGRMIRRILPDGSVQEQAWDAGNRLSQVTDFDGTQLTYGHDALGRLLSRSAPGVSEFLAYTSAGRRSMVTDSRGTTVYAQDDRGRLAGFIEPGGFGIAYQYDDNDQVVQVDADGVVTEYAYDALGRLSAVTTSEGTSTYGYDLNGNLLTKSLPSGVVEEMAYDLRGRPLEVAHLAPDSSLAERFVSTYSDRGKRTSLTQLDGSTETYSYDPIGRLIGGERAGASPFALIYDYDAVGNRVRQVLDGVETLYDYGLNDQLLSTSDGAFAYDARGNRISGFVDGEPVGYQWDAFGRMVGATTPGGSASFGYDVDDRRVSRTVSGDQKRMLIDPLSPSGFPQVVAEFDSSGVSLASWSYGNRALVQRRGGQARFYGTDAHGSVRMLTDPAGALTDSYGYLPYGKSLYDSGGTENPLRFNAERFETTARAYDFRQRSYDACSGSFVSRDPFPGLEHRPFSLHPYQFGDADPINHADPLGLFTLPEISLTTFIQTSIRVAKFCKNIAKLDMIQSAMMILDVAAFFVLLPANNRNIGVNRKFKLSKGRELTLEMTWGLNVTKKGPLIPATEVKLSSNTGRAISFKFNRSGLLSGQLSQEVSFAKFTVCGVLPIATLKGILTVGAKAASTGIQPEWSFKLKFELGDGGEWNGKESPFDGGGIEATVLPSFSF